MIKFIDSENKVVATLEDEDTEPKFKDTKVNKEEKEKESKDE